MSDRLKYFINNWKIEIHLIFRTKRFGVNNQRWSDFDSMMGWSNKKKLLNFIRIKPYIENYKFMKLRAGTMCHFLSDESYRDAFGREKK